MEKPTTRSRTRSLRSLVFRTRTTSPGPPPPSHSNSHSTSATSSNAPMPPTQTHVHDNMESGRRPVSPTFSETSNASRMFGGGEGPEKIITRANLRASLGAYDDLMTMTANYRSALQAMATATDAFAHTLETCASLKGPTYEASTRLQAAAGLHYLIGNNWQFMSETLDRNFEKPLRIHLDAYRTMVNERSAGYEKALFEKSQVIRRTEMGNMKRKERNLQSFREALVILQRQVDELDDLKVAHYQEIMDHEVEVWDVVQNKVCLAVRSTMEVFDKFTTKASDPIIEQMLQSVPDPFDAYRPAPLHSSLSKSGMNGEDDEESKRIFSILPPLSIMANTPSASPSPLVGGQETLYGGHNPGAGGAVMVERHNSWPGTAAAASGSTSTSTAVGGELTNGPPTSSAASSLGMGSMGFGGFFDAGGEWADVRSQSSSSPSPPSTLSPSSPSPAPKSVSPGLERGLDTNGKKFPTIQHRRRVNSAGSKMRNVLSVIDESHQQQRASASASAATTSSSGLAHLHTQSQPPPPPPPNNTLLSPSEHEIITVAPQQETTYSSSSQHMGKTFSPPPRLLSTTSSTSSLTTATPGSGLGLGLGIGFAGDDIPWGSLSDDDTDPRLDLPAHREEEGIRGSRYNSNSDLEAESVGRPENGEAERTPRNSVFSSDGAEAPPAFDLEERVMQLSSAPASAASENGDRSQSSQGTTRREESAPRISVAV